MLRTALFAVSAALLTPAAVHAAEAAEEAAFDLMVGDPAPALTVEWIKGDPIKELRDDTTYVVEFWATWCGPCVRAMPHLSELQAKYAERNVRFVGVNIWEQDQRKVRPFVENMGDKMAYTVAMDIVLEAGSGQRPIGKMATAWMDAAGRDGIPSSFIVQKGLVQWIGHPGEMDKPLADIVGGTWDLEAAKRKHHAAVAGDAAMKNLARSVETAMRAGDWKAAVASIDAALAKHPELEQNVGAQKLFCLARAGDEETTASYAEKLADGVYASHWQGLNFIANVATDPQNRALGLEPAFAVRVAKKANELTKWKEPVCLSTYASALALAGDHEQAVEMQEKAVKLGTGTKMETELKQRLVELRMSRG